MDFLYSIVSFFSTGGAFMYPILVVFAVGVAIAAERYITLTLVTNKNQVVWEQVQPLLSEGEFEKAREMTSECFSLFLFNSESPESFSLSLSLSLSFSLSLNPARFKDVKSRGSTRVKETRK